MFSNRLNSLQKHIFNLQSDEENYIFNFSIYSKKSPYLLLIYLLIIAAASLCYVGSSVLHPPLKWGFALLIQSEIKPKPKSKPSRLSYEYDVL